MLLAGKWIRSAWPGILNLLKPAKVLWLNNNNNNNKSAISSKSKEYYGINNRKRTEVSKTINLTS
jgi:hypothetical protein